jgi:hypothetical protein
MSTAGDEHAQIEQKGFLFHSALLSSSHTHTTRQNPIFRYFPSLEFLRSLPSASPTVFLRAGMRLCDRLRSVLRSPFFSLASSACLCGGRVMRRDEKKVTLFPSRHSMAAAWPYREAVRKGLRKRGKLTHYLVCCLFSHKAIRSVKKVYRSVNKHHSAPCNTKFWPVLRPLLCPDPNHTSNPRCKALWKGFSAKVN